MYLFSLFILSPPLIRLPFHLPFPTIFSFPISIFHFTNSSPSLPTLLMHHSQAVSNFDVYIIVIHFHRNCLFLTLSHLLNFSYKVLTAPRLNIKSIRLFLINNKEHITFHAITPSFFRFRFNLYETRPSDSALLFS